MKIESLLTNNHKCDTIDESASSAADILLVTKISGGVKNKNRVNIFIDDKYDFSLDIAQLAETKLKVGQVLSKSDLSELHRLSSFGKLYARTLEWVLTRPRSEKETRDYLRRKNATNPDPIIDKLLAKNYLNDQNFAKYYLENRFQKKGISLRRLKNELRAKGLSPETIDQAIAQSPRSDAQELAKIISRKRPKYPDDQKLTQYLVRQGFDYELAKTAILENRPQPTI